MVVEVIRVWRRALTIAGITATTSRSWLSSHPVLTFPKFVELVEKNNSESESNTIPITGKDNSKQCTVTGFRIAVSRGGCEGERAAVQTALHRDEAAARFALLLPAARRLSAS
jgi:hypothetical protein